MRACSHGIYWLKFRNWLKFQFGEFWCWQLYDFDMTEIILIYRQVGHPAPASMILNKVNYPVDKFVFGFLVSNTLLQHLFRQNISSWNIFYDPICPSPGQNWVNNQHSLCWLTFPVNELQEHPAAGRTIVFPLNHSCITNCKSTFASRVGSGCICQSEK